jgi:hypothetical protein
MSDGKIRIVEPVVSVVEDKGLDDVESIKGIRGKGKEVVASVSGQKFFLKPCSLNKMEELVKLVKVFEKAAADPNAAPTEILSNDNWAALKAIKGIIFLSMPDAGLSEASIGDHFSLGDFPIVYKIVLDMNDFLAGMKTLYQ